MFALEFGKYIILVAEWLARIVLFGLWSAPRLILSTGRREPAKFSFLFYVLLLYFHYFLVVRHNQRHATFQVLCVLTVFPSCCQLKNRGLCARIARRGVLVLIVLFIYICLCWSSEKPAFVAQQLGFLLALGDRLIGPKHGRA